MPKECLPKVILGIESSCDDTCISALDLHGKVIKEVVVSQTDLHKRFGGVVPEFASRAHVVNFQNIINDFEDILISPSGDCLIELIAVTSGPGLAGPLFSGFAFAFGLAQWFKVPLMKINHIEGHLLSPFIENSNLCFPFLSLIVSGGHCQIVLAKDLGQYTILGSTIDDAPGEVFDKVGRMIDLDYPSGAQIDLLAQKGNPKYKLPLPMVGEKYGLDMSFSGLKTATLLLIRKLQKESIDSKIQGEELFVYDPNTGFSNNAKEDISASFQSVMKKTFCKKIDIAINHVINDLGIKIGHVCICGGVAANSGIRNEIDNVAKKYNLVSIKPSQKYCTDNATMIANVGLMRLNKFGLSDNKYVIDINSSDLDLEQVFANWSLEDI